MHLVRFGKLTTESAGRSTNRNSAVPEVIVIVSQGISTSRALLDPLQGNMWGACIPLETVQTTKDLAMRDI